MKRAVLLLLILTHFSWSSEKPIRVYVDVVGDLFHAGHVQFFQQAKFYGDYLIVGIHGDEAVTDYKRKPILTLDERKTVIEACRYVDEVIINSPIGITKEWIDEHQIDVVIHGDDFDTSKINDQYKVPFELGIFKTVPYTLGISTTEIIKRIKDRVN